MLDTLARDVIYGLRIARRNPGFTIAAVLTLGLGIGVTTTTFTVADAIIFRPLPYAQPERLVKVWGRSSTHPADNMALADFTGVNELKAIFEQVGADDGMGVRVEDGEASHAANAALVTADWLSTLGVRPGFGRGFLAEEFLPGKDNVGVLTHVYWQRRFGGDPAVIGRLLRIDGRPVTIVGVLPPNVLRYGADLLLPLVLGTYPPSREYRNLDVVARLRPDATIAAAQAALDVLARQLERAYSSPEVNREFSVAPLEKNYASIGPGAEQSLMLLLGAVALVLLMACVNVANLLLARSISRERECAVRSALGASRARLAWQLLIENMLLFVAGGGLGGFLAWWSLDVMTALGVSGGYVPERLLVAVDARALGFATLVTLITAVHLRSRPRAARRRGQRQPGIEGREPERTRRLVGCPNPARAHRRRARPVRRPADRMRADRAKPAGTLLERRRLRARPVARDRIGCRARVRACADEVARGARAGPRRSRRRISRLVLAAAHPRRTAAGVQRQRTSGAGPGAGTTGR